MITDDDLRSAWDRVARTADGQLLYLHLQRRLMAISTVVSDGALLASEVERRFAATLMGLMAKGIEESGGSGDTSGSGSGSSSGAERPIVFAVAKPVAVARRTGGRLVGPDDHVAGWDQPDDSKG
jgi:hypothetical protein